MKEGYSITISVHKTVQSDYNAPNRDIYREQVTELPIVDDQFLSCEQGTEVFRLLHDAVETYKRTEVNNEPILEDMRQGFDGLILAMCDMCECTGEEE